LSEEVEGCVAITAALTAVVDGDENTVFVESQAEGGRQSGLEPVQLREKVQHGAVQPVAVGSVVRVEEPDQQRAQAQPAQQRCIARWLMQA
ncbi:hypothetical protein HK405_011245, partial [Cladochytrium tenue]